MFPQTALCIPQTRVFLVSSSIGSTRELTIMSHSTFAGTFFIPGRKQPTLMVKSVGRQGMFQQLYRQTECQVGQRAEIRANLAMVPKSSMAVGTAANLEETSGPQMRQLSALDRRKECPNVKALLPHRQLRQKPLPTTYWCFTSIHPVRRNSTVRVFLMQDLDHAPCLPRYSLAQIIDEGTNIPESPH